MWEGNEMRPSKGVLEEQETDLLALVGFLLCCGSYTDCGKGLNCPGTKRNILEATVTSGRGEGNFFKKGTPNGEE